uniref:Small integral membrane protein 4 n=1 Tax=Timema poppense TaxID=170557 RepID=A0A7R9CX68_TIMPO|nr:unnamed protein product [Timema poppensis]
MIGGGRLGEREEENDVQEQLQEWNEEVKECKIKFPMAECEVTIMTRKTVKITFYQISMKLYSRSLQKILNLWPGKKYLGIYRFLPLFFVLGATLEFSMINWHVGEINFYKTFKRRQAEKLAEDHLHSNRSQK